MDTEKKFLQFIYVVAFLFVASVVSGTILWLLWEHLFITFPKLEETGTLVRHIEWWNAVCITWIIHIVFKAVIKSKKDDE